MHVGTFYYFLEQKTFSPLSRKVFAKKNELCFCNGALIKKESSNFSFLMKNLHIFLHCMEIEWKLSELACVER